MNENTPGLRVATYGCGYFSQFHYAAWARLPVRLVAVANRENEPAEAVAAEHSIAAIYEDPASMLEAEKPDLLDIITPPETHLATIGLAAESGIDVICQKPFTRSLKEARQAVQIADEAGIRLIVHENFRFQPWYREIRRLLGQGALGELYSAEFRLRPGDGQGEQAYRDRQPAFRDMPRFLINETAVHFVDVFRFLFGDMTDVYADLRQLNPAIRGEDAGQVMMRFANGIHATFDGNRLADHAAENQRLTMGELRVEGSAGELLLDGDARIRLRRRGKRRFRTHRYAWQDIGFGGDCVYHFLEHVLRHLSGNGPIETRAADYLVNLQIVDAVYASAEIGRRITVKK